MRLKCEILHILNSFIHYTDQVTASNYQIISEESPPPNNRKSSQLSGRIADALSWTLCPIRYPAARISITFHSRVLMAHGGKASSPGPRMLLAIFLYHGFCCCRGGFVTWHKGFLAKFLPCVLLSMVFNYK